MTRFVTTTAIALLIGVAPALAIEDSAKVPNQSGTIPEASQSENQSLPSNATAGQQSNQGQLPTQPGTTPDVAKQAAEPAQGSPDMSGGARERSSAPPSSGAASAGASQSSDSMPSDSSKE
jgi:hypothetical protein